MTNSANTVTWRWDGDPFGFFPASEDPDGNAQPFTVNLRFPGQYFDKETNLHYNYYRDYDPQTGRYVQSDPIGLLGGLNTYSYVSGNPIANSDPTGEVNLPGVAIGIGIELGIQAFNNYRAGCDIWNFENYNWYDVGIAGAIGAIAPGWGAVGRKTFTSGRAIASLSEQLGRAQTANRAAKIATRIQAHTSGVVGDLVTQSAFQATKYIGSQITDAGGANNCSCRE